jgi:hypothetical protein
MVLPLEKNVECQKYNNNKIFKTITLSKNYNSIGEINFYKEAELKKMFMRYEKSYCSKFLMFNDNIGYLALGCQVDVLAGSGVCYKLELQNNKLILYVLYRWVS